MHFVTHSHAFFVGYWLNLENWKKLKHLDANTISGNLKKNLSNIIEETIKDSIITELINQGVLENKKLVYEDSFYITTERDKKIS